MAQRTFEEIQKALADIVKELESGKLTPEETAAKIEEAARLARASADAIEG